MGTGGLARRCRQAPDLGTDLCGSEIRGSSCKMLHAPLPCLFLHWHCRACYNRGMCPFLLFSLVLARLVGNKGSSKCHDSEHTTYFLGVAEPFSSPSQGTKDAECICVWAPPIIQYESSERQHLDPATAGAAVSHRFQPGR